MNISADIYNLIINSLQSQFVDEENENLNAGIDLLQKLGQIFVDENPDNKAQLSELLQVLGKAAKEANLLD